MNFLIFLLYYIICTFILFVLVCLFQRAFVKHKLNTISRVTEKAIDDFFNFDYDDFGERK